MKPFDIFYKEYYVRVTYFCEKILGNREDAEDITQEAMIKFVANFDQVEDGCHYAYICQTAKRLCFNVIKYNNMLAKNLRDYKYEDLEPSFEEKIIKSEVINNLLNSFSILPKGLRKILEYIVLDDLSYNEVSKITGKSQSTIRNQYSRGITLLCEYFETERKSQKKIVFTEEFIKEFEQLKERVGITKACRMRGITSASYFNANRANKQ